MKNYIAFFDLDHTILNTSSGKLFIKHSFENNLISLREMLLGFFIGMVHKLGIYESEKIIKKWVMKYCGISEKGIIDYTNLWFNEAVIKHLRKSAIEEIKYHNSNGGKTVLLSASTPYICNPVKDYLDMDDVICSQLEVVDGKFTGRIIGRYCYKEEKLKRAIKFCDKHEVSIKQAYYYADSFADVPVLEYVAKPICISPDRRLRRMAKKRGWEIRKW